MCRDGTGGDASSAPRPDPRSHPRPIDRPRYTVVGSTAKTSACTCAAERTWVRSLPRKGLCVHILVADDMPMVRRLCCSILRGAGHKVVEAEDGQGALAAYAERRPGCDPAASPDPGHGWSGRPPELRTLDPLPTLSSSRPAPRSRSARRSSSGTHRGHRAVQQHAILTALEHSFEAGATAEVKIYSWTSTVNAKAYGRQR